MNWLAAAATASLTLAANGVGVAQELSNPQLLLRSVAPSGPQSFVIDAWADAPDLTYRVGEQVRLFLRGSRDAYYVVLAVASDGTATQLYPEPGEEQRAVLAGAVLTVPDPVAGRMIHAVYPAGIDLIRIVGTTAPIRLLPAGGARSVPADVAAANLQQELLRIGTDPASVTDLELRTVDGRDCGCDAD